MAVLTYVDFDLLIERAGSRYKARVLSSPGGSASRTFELPFSREQLQIFLLTAIGLGRNRKVRRMESPEMQAVKAFGGELFESLFDDELLDCLRLSLHDTERDGTGLRIRLRLDDTVDAPATDGDGTEADDERADSTVALCDVPWEFMYDSGGPGFLSLSSGSPLVRYQDLRKPVERITIAPPLKLLVMICAPSNAPELDVEHERTKVEEALGDLVASGQVQVDWLEHGTLKQLRRSLRAEYHAFHFIGHGGYDPRAKTGALLFENANGFREPVSAEFLRTIFQGRRSLQLAVLNACEGSRTNPADPFAGVAQSLVRGGVAAVIAMQFEISDDAAIILSSEFYSALADGYPVDAALSEARTAVYTGVSPVEWAIPVLYLRSPDAAIFDVTAPPSTRPPEPRDGDQAGEEEKEPQKRLIDVSRDGEDGEKEPEKKEERQKQEEKPEEKSFFERLSRRSKLIAAAALIVVAALVLTAILDDGPVPPDGSGGQAASLDVGDIVFVRRGDILAVDPADPGRPWQLVAAEANDFAPSLSPDMSQIVFGGGPNGAVDDIYVAGTDGRSPPKNLTNTPEANEETASWSADGSRIVFDRAVDGNFDIWVMNADGSDHPHPLTSGDANDKRPEWSPKGDLIVFERALEGNQDIFVMDTNGQGERPFLDPASDLWSDSEEGAPVWSADGDQIAFRSARGHERDFELWIVDADGLDAREITTGVISLRAPAWSPDGEEIVYSRGPLGEQDLYTIDVDGGASTPLLTSPGDDRGATWCCYQRRT
jgi:dipeptidyl aminopeptidase/acylaminoacyl peptidase